MNLRKNIFIFPGAFLLLPLMLAYCSNVPSAQADYELVPQTGWSLVSVDSEELIGEDGAAVNTFDGDENTIWHTKYTGGDDPQPHEIQIDLGNSHDITGFRYAPCLDNDNGRIKDHEFYVSADGSSWTLVSSGVLSDHAFNQNVLFEQKEEGVRYIKLKSLSAYDDDPWTAVSEINLLRNIPVPQTQADSGLWGTYNRSGDLHCHFDPILLKWVCNNDNGWTDEVKALHLENLDFDALFPGDPLNSFGLALFNRTGRIPYVHSAYVTWRGAIYMEETGDYNFRVDMNGNQQYYIQIDNKCAWPVSASGSYYKYGDVSHTKAYTAGWHKILIRTHVYATSLNTKFQVYWTPPGKSEEILPADKLNHEHWADDVITIPSSGKDKAHVNYVAAGVGALEAVENGIDPQIEIDMPVANLDKIFKDDVWISWFSRNNIINETITALNNNTGGSSAVTGVKTTSKYGLTTYPNVIAKIPASLIDDGGTGKLSFSFSGLGVGGAKANGLGMIVPYEGPTKPKGRISLKMYNSACHHGVSPTFVFPIKDDMHKDNIQPLFFLNDGESKEHSFRPNYLMMLSGSGSVPDDHTLLQNVAGAQMIIPESNPIDRSNENTWYPNYGREGDMLDVVSSNYVPNQWAGKYTIYEGTEDGKIDPISIPGTHTWIAFQYYSSNFNADGVTRSGESGSISGGGLFSTAGSSENYALAVTVEGNGSVTSSPAGIDCPGDCLGTYFSGTPVTLTAAAGAGYVFSGWSGSGCSGTGTCIVMVDTDKAVTATFDSIPPVVGICGIAANQPSRSAPTENLCAAGTVSLSGVQYNSSTGNWEWTCEGGAGNDFCEAEKYRGWKEVVL